MKVKLVFFYILMVLFIATDVFIFIEAGTDASGSSNQSMGITQMLVDFVRLFDPNSEFVTNPDFAHHVVRKLVGHFGLFGVSGILTTADLMLIDEGLSNKKVQIIISSLGAGITVAIFSEVLQSFTPGRAFAFADIGIDFAGYILFGGITLLIGLLIHRHKEKKE